LNKYNVN